MDFIQFLWHVLKFGVRVTRRLIQLRGSASWPLADGTIFEGQVRAGELGGWMTDLTYSYSARGEYYSGTYRQTFPMKKKAESFLERFPRGTAVPVAYAQEKPEISTLRRQDLSIHLAGF